ncbi:MAG TPA: hypothetical protein VLJ59_17000 [Mycobacteriales bacterium]|nr:hypothetical protein [Mycobacteriales bacterium]
MTAVTAAPPSEATERTGVPAALSSDELRALARVAGAVLPPELLDGWHREDIAVADTVAVRSLLARGLLQLRPGGVALTRAARGALDPLLDARALAGLSLLGRDGDERRQLVAESTAGTLLLTEREPDVWTLDPIPGPAERAPRGWPPTCWRRACGRRRPVWLSPRRPGRYGRPTGCSPPAASPTWPPR